MRHQIDLPPYASPPELSPSYEKRWTRPHHPPTQMDEDGLERDPHIVGRWTGFVDPPTQDACVKSVCDFGTPLREVQDRHQPPSYGNLENVLKT